MRLATTKRHHEQRTGKVEEGVRVSGVQQMLTSFRLAIKLSITVKSSNASDKKTILKHVQSLTVDLAVKNHDKVEQRETRLGLSTITNIFLELVIVALNDQNISTKSSVIPHRPCLTSM